MNIIHETPIPPHQTLDMYTRLEVELGMSRESAMHWLRRFQREQREGRQS